MEIIYVLLPLSLLLALAGLGAYLWTVNSGQLDDLSTPPLRVLHDEEDDSNTEEADTGRPPDES